MDVLDNVRNEFKEIIDYLVKKGELHERSEFEVRTFANYLESQTEQTRIRLIDVLQKINYETIVPNEEDKIWPDLEFWRGMDDYGTVVALNFGGGIETLNNFQPIVKGRYEDYIPYISETKVKQSIKINLEKFPISLHGRYEYKFNETYLYHAWLAFLWQDIDGYNCGIKVNTVENNSIVTFSFNDFLDSDFSSFVDYSCNKVKPAKINRYFPRKLSLKEIYLRALQKEHSYFPYKNYWRYFEKDDNFVEIVIYGYSTGIRKGKLADFKSVDVINIINHQTQKITYTYLTHFTNQMIFEGWREKFRPFGSTIKMNQSDYEFDFIELMNWPANKKNQFFEFTKESFENKIKATIPDSYYNFVKLLSEGNLFSGNTYFPINNLYTVQVKSFFNFYSLNAISILKLNQNSCYFWIGELMDDGNSKDILLSESILNYVRRILSNLFKEKNRLLGIVTESGEQFGKVVLGNKGKIEVCDYTFDKFIENVQNLPKQPEIFAAEENDVDFLSERINEGWDCNSSYFYQNAVTQAAEFNAHDALELLLKAGAKFSNNNYKTMTDIYDFQTIELLDKYYKK